MFIHVIPSTVVFYIFKLRDRFRKAFTNELSSGDPTRCEFSGDALAADLMHIIPFRAGSSVFSALIFGLETGAARTWATMATELYQYPHDHSHPIIGNVALLDPRQPLIPRKNPAQEWNTGPRALGCINLPINLFVGSKALHWIDDTLHGVLKSVIPAVWLEATEIVYTPVCFTKESHLPRRDENLPISVADRAEQVRFVFLWLADAYNIYQRFGTAEFKEKLNAVKGELIESMHNLKAEQGQEEAARKRAAKKGQTDPMEVHKKDGDDRDIPNQPGFERLALLLTDPAIFEYIEPEDEDEAEYEPELTDASKRLLADVFRVQEDTVTADHVEAFIDLQDRVVFFLSVAQNFAQTA
ncbi:hypothetical protein B0H16DRAFT_1681621 [Mycena metata]|uniref:Uncharacterized protein n=1 Tax=Mycena metata TaxID=1033252 RepID=A0AAD7KJ26_9AGAR|nr:hypothetical protein B0H16DRAFT_1681621 [Mycena metata]